MGDPHAGYAVQRPLSQEDHPLSWNQGPPLIKVPDTFYGPSTGEQRLWFLVELPIHPAFAGEVTGEVAKLLRVIEGPMKRRELQFALGLKHEDYFREAYLVPALEAGLIEMTIPTNPAAANSSAARPPPAVPHWSRESPNPEPAIKYGATDLRTAHWAKWRLVPGLVSWTPR